ncbi:MAG: hypothetical protein AAF961_03280, partial [Planctomycetota bacterium]
EIDARNNPHTNFLDPALIDDAYDYNRDARVNATDQIIARNNQTNFLSDLNLITPGGAPPVIAALHAAPEALPPERADVWSGRRWAPPPRTAFHTDEALASLDVEATPQQAHLHERPMQVSYFRTEEPEPTSIDELMEDVELLKSLAHRAS